MSGTGKTRNGYDAIVVGARCAGASTAMLLARGGARVLVVDRETYGADTLSTHALMRTGVALLQRWGVLDRIVAAGTPAVRSTTFVYGDEQVEIEIAPGDGITALHAPRRTVIDRLLVDAASEAGAEIRYGWFLEALIFEDGRAVGTVLRRPDGSTIAEHADLVIGADGRTSTVARFVAAPTLIETQASSAGVFGYLPRIENRGYRWFFRPGAHMAVIPTNDGAHCVAVFVPRDRYRENFGPYARAGFQAMVASFDPELGGIVAGEPDARLSRYTGGPGYLRLAQGPGWALVGDAGYFKDPVTAHGITDALRDAALLAAAVLGAEPGALARYQDLRDRLSMPLFKVTGEIAAFDWSLDRLKILHAGLSGAMKVELTHMMTAQTLPALAA